MLSIVQIIKTLKLLCTFQVGSEDEESLSEPKERSRGESSYFQHKNKHAVIKL